MVHGVRHFNYLYYNHSLKVVIKSSCGKAFRVEWLHSTLTITFSGKSLTVSDKTNNRLFKNWNEKHAMFNDWNHAYCELVKLIWRISLIGVAYNLIGSDGLRGVRWAFLLKKNAKELWSWSSNTVKNMTFEAVQEKFPVAGLKMYIEKTIEKLSMKNTWYTAVFILCSW